MADTLLTKEPADLAASTVVIPTQRLATWIMAQLAERLGTYVPPRLLTFETFVRREYAGLEEERSVAMTCALEVELLIAAWLRQTRPQHLRPGIEHELGQLLAELVTCDLEDVAFSRVREALAADFYRSDAALLSLSGRVDEFIALFEYVRQSLARQGLETAETGLRRQSHGLAAHLESGGDLASPHLYLIGFTSIAPCHERLLRALAERPNTTVWVSAPISRPKGPNPLASLAGSLGVEEASIEPTLPTQRDHSKNPVICQLKDPMSEIAHALRLAKAAVDFGASPASIVILIADERRYAPLARLLANPDDFGGLNIAAPLPARATPLGNFLIVLLEHLAAPADLTRIAALLGHELMGHLAAGPGERDTSRRAKVATPPVNVASELYSLGLGPEVALTHLQKTAGLSPSVQGLVEAAVDLLSPLATPIASLSDFIDRLTTVVNQIVGAAAVYEQKGRSLHTAAREAVAALLAELKAAARLFGAPVESHRVPNDALRLVSQRFAGLDVRGIGEPLHGLQVMGIEEARYIPFELAIIVGCTEGSFPRALPHDVAVEPWIRRKAGLPGWATREAIEDTTFHLLRARLPRLVMTYPEEIDGLPAVRSRFVETLLAHGEADFEVIDTHDEIVTLLKNKAPAPCATLTAESRLNAPAGAYGGERRPLFNSLSSSRLSHLLTCPYRFLMHSLHLLPLEPPRAEDPRLEGQWLHKVLETFFTAPRHDESSTPLATLRHLTDRQVPEGARFGPGWLQAQTKSWPAFADHFARLYSSGAERIHAGLREHRFDVTIEQATPPLRLVGFIDAVERLADGLVVLTDYKRRHVPGASAVASGAEPQLLVYALALAHGAAGQPVPLEDMASGYWSILGGHWSPGPCGAQAVGRAQTRGLAHPRRAVSLETAVSTFLDQWTDLYKRLVKDGAPFAPALVGCETCSYAGLCRRHERARAPLSGSAFEELTGTGDARRAFGAGHDGRGDHGPL